MILKYTLFTLTVSVVPLFIILKDAKSFNFIPKVILDSVSVVNSESFNQLLASGIFTYFTAIGVIKSEETDSASNSLFTEEEIKQFNGISKDKRLYLAILGNVFDVSKAAKYYGPGETYNAFTGRDGSRAFVTGDFTESGLTDDVEGLTLQELRSLNDWVKFYFKEYTYKGKLVGRYYDKTGNPTGYLHKLQLKLEEADRDEKDKNKYKLMYPPCNVEWTPEEGSRVWCSKRSGGIERDWIGVPRKFYEPGGSSYRCACVNNADLPQVISPETGKVRSKNIEEYEDCHPKSSSCFVDAD
ncbi:neuferricin-like isoform X1 [Macrosteles quadrilineatus]|uniref:neuferricin-like isoform X1 n=1 Tax=Macrosteles quadrilineatus TaxID=74068 RepID=UPI0023E2C479|nr:neuferricin-like isoform X1 [Macrosteles quadrilineatus]XP_054289607.1 neuferricin-like isoform X1 [Macrosteles quadrilineatus]